MGAGVSTDFKSSNRIKISQLVQVLLNFEWFRGCPLGVRGGPSGGGGVVRGCTPPMCTCMHIWHHREFPGIPPMGAAICMKLSCLPRACVHACMCMHACAHVWGAPPTTPTLIHPHPPTPRATGSPNHQNSITLELIELIRFCLKILYLWTFLNSYRLKLITPEPPTIHLPHPQSWGNPNRKNYNNSWMNRDNSILFKDLWPGCPITNCTFMFLTQKSAPVMLQ